MLVTADAPLARNLAGSDVSLLTLQLL